MPELPEVETVRRGLLPVLEGHHIVSAKTRRGNLRIPFPPRFAERLKGRTVQHLRRRAKYLVADLDSGESLIVHLGMSGRMTIYRKGKVLVPGEFEQETMAAKEGHGLHDHVIFETDAPARIVFTDHRRFGLMTLVKTDELEADKLFKDIGPEPLGNTFSAPVLSAALKGKKTSIKAALLDQRVVAGLGNIYVCEALFRSHISPKRKASTVAGKRAEVLVPAIKRVLEDAIEAGGSTLRDYAKADGSLGYFQHRFSVYDREGEPCPTKGCKDTIKRIVQAGRSTFFCPACQR